MADLWDYVESGWDAVTDTVSDWWDEGTDYLGDVTGYTDYVTDTTGLSPTEIDLYGLEDTYDVGVGSFLTSTAGDIWDTASSWASSSPFSFDASKFATSAATALWGEGGMPKADKVKGGRLSGSARSSGTTGSYKANPVDLGYTAKVQNALRTAMNSQTGSGSIEATLAMLRARQSKGPLLQIPEATISVKSKRLRD